MTPVAIIDAPSLAATSAAAAASADATITTAAVVAGSAASSTDCVATITLHLHTIFSRICCCHIAEAHKYIQMITLLSHDSN